MSTSTNILRHYSVYSLILALCIICGTAFGQQAKSGYTLSGTINADSGSMRLILVAAYEYYPCKVSKEVKVVNGHFTFADSITYPVAYKMGMRANGKWLYRSDVFFVEPGMQTVVCNTEATKETPPVQNAAMTEYAELNTYLSNAGADKNEALLNYVKAHPDSYVALWKLAEKMNTEYVPACDSIYKAFSATLKKTQTGKVLGGKLGAARLTAVGQHFPQLHLTDSAGKQAMAPAAKSKNKYTLVYFWNPDCPACLSQFTTLRGLYSTYKKGGFEIAGIATESDRYKADWKKMIRDKQLTWPQYRDAQMANVEAMDITNYPTTFLLDAEGKVIRKNITMDELETLLTKEIPAAADNEKKKVPAVKKKK